MRNGRVLILAAALAVPLSLLFAQATAVVQISGVVTDANGASIPGAQVKAVQTSTGFVRTAAAGVNGAYTLANLPVGPYRLEASADGFKSFVQQGIVLQVNTNPTVNVVLQVGPLSQEIRVTADATMVETRNNSVSQVIDQQRVVDLPLNGRQATQLILLSGAAVTPPPRDLTSSKNYPSSTAIAVAGGQANGTYYLMDGGDHNDAFGYVNLPMPFPDAVQEFSVQMNNAPASYGVRAGAVVNIVTKSGTNEFHGDLFEFVRTGATNARNFFASRKDSLKRNQFGGTLGGPLLKNRLFFFGGYQGTRIRTAPPTTTVFVPDSSVAAGNLSVFASGACGAARTLTDPQTGRPFPNNTIAPSRFSPQSVALLKYVPQSSDPCGKYLFGIPDNQGEDQVIGRADWIRSERHTVFGRYFFTDFRNPGVFDGKNMLLTTKPGALDRVQTLVLGDTYGLGPSTINSFHFTWSRKRITRGLAPNVISAKDIGVNIGPAPPGNFPSLTVNGRFSMSCGTCAGADIGNNSLQFADDLNLVRGRHQIALGVDWIHNGQIFIIQTESAASFTFDGSQTGDPLADFLLGMPNRFHQGNPQNVQLKQNYIGAYVEDKFRASSRLTINAGLRWEPFFPAHDIFGQANHFDYAAFRAGERSTKFRNAPAGMFFPGDPGMPPGGANHRVAGFAPRAGLVWDPAGNGRMTVRISYGILYDFPHLQNWNRFGVNPPFASAINIFSPAGGFGNPYVGYPGGNPFPVQFPPGPDAAFPAGGQFINFPLDLRPAYMQQWNLTVQRQLGADWLVTASYLGNKSTHRLISRESNPAIYLPGACNGKPCSTVANTNDRRILSRDNPVEGSLISSLVEGDNGANASYNALLLSANHRLRNNFSVLVNYTWSHCVGDGDVKGGLAGSDYQNPFNRSASRSNCIADIRHIFNTSLVATMPNFKRRMLQRSLGNWELSAIITKRSGFWFNVVSGKDNSLTAVNNDRPDIVGDPHAGSQSLTQWFNTAAFRANAAGTYGNSGANNLTGPGAFNLDAALMRRFNIRENQGFEIRAEAFNLLNHPNFANPRASLTDASFGRILSAADPRILQFAIKYRF